jgi:hypothetical protein
VCGGRDQGIAVRITGKDVESGRGLGRYPWVVERTIAWLFRLPPACRALAAT